VTRIHLRKRHLHDNDRTDRRYWLERSYLERFRAVELISNPGLAEHAQQAFPRYTGDMGLAEGDFRQADSVIEIGREPTKVQVLTGIDGVDFATAFANRIDVDLDGLSEPFLGFDDLLRNKRASARSKDLIDVDELERIRLTKPGADKQ
jgi:hypothetical protein